MVVPFKNFLTCTCLCVTGKIPGLEGSSHTSSHIVDISSVYLLMIVAQK